MALFCAAPRADRPQSKGQTVEFGHQNSTKFLFLVSRIGGFLSTASLNVCWCFLVSGQMVACDVEELATDMKVGILVSGFVLVLEILEFYSGIFQDWAGKC